MTIMYTHDVTIDHPHLSLPSTGCPNVGGSYYRSGDSMHLFSFPPLSSSSVLFPFSIGLRLGISSCS